MNPPTRIELITQEKPVNWLSPGQLLQTGLRALTAGEVGVMADPRLVQAALSPDESSRPTFTAADTAGPLWIDYLADTGDGWDATYTVAHTVAQAQIRPEDPATDPLPQADLLILGGDQVYPTPADSAYRTRFLDPFRSALPAPIEADQPGAPETRAAPGDPQLFALPGNHDWYDGLHGFMQTFCSQRGIGRWQTRQRRSYWALQLRHGWWIWGLDLQLQSQMDTPQLDYFRAMADRLAPGDQVVLCAPEPSWTDANVQRGKADGTPLDSLERLPPRFSWLRDIERLILRRPDGSRREGVELAAVLAGDQHHYARYQSEDADAPVRITCGGGGAYLLGTHDLPDRLDFRGASGREQHRKVSSFPSANESRRLRDQIWKLPATNPVFAATLAGIHMLWVLLLASSLPLALLWGLVVTGAAALFTRNSAPTDQKTRATWAGGVHGLLHLLLPLVLLSLIDDRFGPQPPWVQLGAVLAEGWLIGGLLFGLWLMLTNRWAGWHGEEVFSAQAIADWRCLLRMRIDAQGLTIYPLGIRKSCRRWSIAAGIDVLRQAGSTWRLRTTPTASGPRFVPLDPIQVELIEPPIVIPRTSR
jgi:hypothetical protein